MSKPFGRLLLIYLAALCLLAVCSGALWAGLSLDSSPTRATANSVWNFKAIWQDDEGIWPLAMPFLLGFENAMDWNPTIGRVRPYVEDEPEGSLPQGFDFWPQLFAPSYPSFADDDPVNPGQDYEAFQPNGWVCFQPDPGPLVKLETDGDPRYDHGLDFEDSETESSPDAEEGVPISDPPVSFQITNGEPTQGLWRPDPENNTPAILVPKHIPIWLVGVWSDSSRTNSVKAIIRKASDVNADWPEFNIIVLPDGIPAGTSRLYVSYYYPGIHYVVTKRFPLAMNHAVYVFPPDTRLNAPNITRIRVNPAILDLNETGSDPNGSDSQILGLFDNPDLVHDPGNDQHNYWVPGNYEPPDPFHPAYGVINIDPNTMPPGGVPRNRTLYLQVRTTAVVAVRDDNNNDYYIGANGQPSKYDSKQGIIRLAQQLLDPQAEEVTTGQNEDGTTKKEMVIVAGKQVWVDYRPLSRDSFTVGEPTLLWPTALNPLPPNADYEFDPTAVSLSAVPGRFTLTEDNAVPVGTYAAGILYAFRDPDTPLQGVVWLLGTGGVEPVPMYYVKDTPRPGAEYRVAVSAGLNMSNLKQQPSSQWLRNTPVANNKLIYDPRGHPMWHAPNLVAWSDGTPKEHKLSAIGYFIRDGELEWYEVKDYPVMVHDSRPNYIAPDGKLEMIDYAGQAIDRDRVTCYPDTFGASWPYGYDVDPLSIEPIEELNPTAPDDGSSTTEFVFRCRYRHRDGTNLMPPLPWLHWSDDPWLSRPRYTDAPTGVVLYLDESGTGDYRPHFMDLENPWAQPEDDDYDVYIYRISPKNVIGIHGDPPPYPWQDFYRYVPGSVFEFDNEGYQSLGIGVYHYFFACSDDSLKFDGGSFPFENQSFPFGNLEYGEDPYFPYLDWSTRCSTGLDPSLPRAVAGYEEIDRSPRRKYTADGTLEFDYTIHVDRPVRVPGLFEHGALGYEYKWDAEHHPEITSELRMPVYDDKYVRYDDEIYGSGRFFGTIQDFYRASNPAHIGSHTDGPDGALAETHGAKSNTDNVFRILYKSADNKPPIYIKIYINNASEKSGTTPDHQYTAYTMYPRADQTPPYNYRNGVWYEYKTKLPPGPHTYYFQSYDGHHIARFPVRPDFFPYAHVDFSDNRKIIHSGDFSDWWVPTYNRNTERLNEDYFDNDYIPGPYVNNPCVLSEPTVTPGTGKEGQSFRYRVKYADPDGQRVYSAYITIEINDRGDTRTFQMMPETPIFLPDPNDPEREQKYQEIIQKYKDGVYYVFDTGTVNDFALQKGVRRYYFEFTDDWGRLHDVNDTILGETTRYPTGGGNWVSGPVISGNIPPTLSNGGVESQDGTSNAATLWTYRVTYRDLNNDPPAFIKLYIGLLQPDGKTIMWDDGHTLAKNDPGDQVYTDGVDYYFQTRLGAVDTVVAGEPEPAPKQYYYAFEAYDGVAWATYKSSANDEIRSNAAGAMILHEAEQLDTTTYKFAPLVAQQGAVTSPTTVTPKNSGDILRVVGVYATEDLTGTNYYQPGPDPPDYDGQPIALAVAFPAGKTKAWIQYEAQSPIVGPLPIDLPAPAGVIPDAQIFENHSSNPVPILIDDQKNGWVSEIDPVNDRGLMVMEGLGVFEGEPSDVYVLPADPGAIASVDGVYIHPDFSGTNYYDPEFLDPPIAIEGTVDPDNRRIVIPSRPDIIVRVRGVYDNEELTGTNYYPGDMQLLWQEALPIATNSVWPTDPLNIVSVEGVYLGMQQSLFNYCRPDRLSVQNAQMAELTVKLTNPADVEFITGIYLQVDAGGDPVGDNYYEGGGPPPPPPPPPQPPNPPPPPPGPSAYPDFVNPTRPLPLDVAQVYVFYVNSLGQELMQLGNTYVSAVRGADMQSIQEVLGVYMAVDADDQPTGDNYYDPTVAQPPFAVGDSLVELTTPAPRAGGTDAYYIYYVNRGFGYGPEGEYLALTHWLEPNVTKTFVAYHAPGTLNEDGEIALSTPIPLGIDTVYIRIEPETFKCGDKAIRLTTDLPNPIHPAEPDNRTVYIKYSDIRFTHQLRGLATQPIVQSWGWGGKVLYWYIGTTHYSPDGWAAGNVHIKGNVDDGSLPPGDAVTSGLVGVWLNRERDKENYYDPRKANRYQDNLLHLRLTKEVPKGSDYLWARYYQKGDYHIDRWNRRVVFLEQRDASSKIQGSYFFGTRMQQTLGPNTACEVYGGKVTPLTGSRSTQYVYSVTYRDLDGPNGQAPAYVRVYIDGQPFDMTTVNTGGTPAYREGATYTFTPTGLAGGAHKFHFEATDGVSISWFDANGSHQSLVGSASMDVVDIDGPYVNNPPDLTEGAASPNPTTGTIGTNESVDYTVVFTDLDNNPPYFFDPVVDLDENGQPIAEGPSVSGSPRVWIDSGTSDQSYTGTVAGLAPDPLETSKTRTIVAEGSPGWAADQFAGKLLQITNGLLDGRVYLIQSSTENKLIIATDDLVKDGVKQGATFRINGLLMQKADPTQQDFTVGVLYKITVPKLAVGSHKFHFTARSRELKPQWLREMMIAQGQTPLPYSGEVRLPISGDFSGPVVARSIPEGNREPVLENSEVTALWRGPKVQFAAVDSSTTAKPNDFLKIRSALGVYLNANLAGDSYYDPATTTTPFKPGDTDIKLSPTLPAIPDTTELVQIGVPAAAQPIGTNLRVLIPDAASAVGEVLGVYLESDPDTAGTNYYDPAAANPAFAPGDSNITLTTPLPSGTSRAYIKYRPIVLVQDGGVSSTSTAVPSDPAAVAYVVGVYLPSDTGMTNSYYDPATADPAFEPGDGSIALTTPLPGDATEVKIKYVAWPPAYVEYFAFADASNVYLAGEQLTFWVKYKDPDNDPPTYHDSVQGYVKVVFNDSGRSTQLLPENPPVTDYTIFVPFSVTLTDVPEGTHKYHFEGSDGYYDIAFPKGTSTNKRANDYTIVVNYKPVIKSGTVDHTSGATAFTFVATYQDKDNKAPQIVTVTLKKTDDPTKVFTYEMTRDPAETNPNYSTGVRYLATVNAKDEARLLPSGRYNVVFEANDGHQDATPLMGPDIVVRDTNIAPVVVNYMVTPASGKTGITFVYSGWYHDDEGDNPVAVSAGQRVEGLTLVVDKDSPTEQRLIMTRPDTGPPDYTAEQGVEFKASLSGKKLGPGKHTYTVIANDGTDNSTFASGVPPIKNGPVMMVPYFGLRVNGRDGLDITDRAVVGAEALISGHMYFPYAEGEAPRPIDDVTIQVTKPGGNAIALNASVTDIQKDPLTPHETWIGDITVNYGGFVDPALSTGDSLTLTASGQWKISAVWPGDSDWDRAETDSNMDGQNDNVLIRVSGPSRTIAVEVPENPETSPPVIDMITPPMIIGSPDPGAIFGADRALEMRIVRWSPGSNTYFRYGVDGLFPPLQPGDAIWIKPRPYNPVTKTGYPAAEPLGLKGVLHLYTDTQDTIQIPPNQAGATDYVAYVSGVYLNSSLTGPNYYDPLAAAVPFRQGDSSFTLTNSLPADTEVWVDYVIFPFKGVNEGWIALDNPTVARALDGGEPRYYHTNYRLVKSLSQAYPLKTDALGNAVLDPKTKLPLLKPCYISLKTGWNQIGNIFFNWKKVSQQGLPLKNDDGTFDLGKVQPVDPQAIQGKLLGVYLTPDMSGDNYYAPGIATKPYRAGDTYITLTKSLPAGSVSDSTRLYIKHEAYPREDNGIPIKDLYVNYLGQRKSLSEAAAAGWIRDYAWRYDPYQRVNVPVHATAGGAERVLKAWSGYWIRAFVNCTLEIDPNTSYNGPVTGLSAGLARESAAARAAEAMDVPPPIPD